MTGAPVPPVFVDRDAALRWFKLVHAARDRVIVFAYPDEKGTKVVNREVELGGHPGPDFWRDADLWLRNRMSIAASLAAFESGHRRTKENARQLRVLGIDIDVKHALLLCPTAKTAEEIAQAAAQKLAGLGLPPHFFVSSGRGVHVYLRTEPLDVSTQSTRVDVEDLWWRIANTLGGATEKCDVTTVLRLPGCFNFKEGGCQPVRFLAGFDESLVRPPYKMSELKMAAAALPGRPPKGKKKSGAASGAVSWVLTPAAKAALDFAITKDWIADQQEQAYTAPANSKKRSELEFGYACTLARLGFSSREISSEISRCSKGRTRDEGYWEPTTTGAMSAVYRLRTDRSLREIHFYADISRAIPIVLGRTFQGERACDPKKSILVTMTRAGDGKTSGLLDVASLRQVDGHTGLVISGLFVRELLRHEDALNSSYREPRIYLGPDGEVLREPRRPADTHDAVWKVLAAVVGHTWTRERFETEVADPTAFQLNLHHPYVADEGLQWEEDESGKLQLPSWARGADDPDLWQPYAVTKFAAQAPLCIAGHDQNLLSSRERPCSKCEFLSCRANTNRKRKPPHVGAKTLWARAPIRLVSHQGLNIQQRFGKQPVKAEALVLDELPDDVYRVVELGVSTPATFEAEWKCGDLDRVITLLNRIALQSQKTKKKTAVEMLRRLQQRRQVLMEACSRARDELAQKDDLTVYTRINRFSPFLTTEECRRVLGWERDVTEEDDFDDERLDTGDAGALKRLLDFAGDADFDVIEEHQRFKSGAFRYVVRRPINCWPDFLNERDGNPRAVLILDATAGVDPRYLLTGADTEEQYPAASYPNTTLVLTASRKSKNTLAEELAQDGADVVRRVVEQFRRHADRVGPRLLVITQLEFEDEVRAGLEAQLPNAQVAHFGALRGRNDLVSFDAVYFTHVFLRPNHVYVGLAMLLGSFDGLPRDWTPEDELRRGRREDEKDRAIKHPLWQLADLLRWRWAACDFYQDAMRIALRSNPAKPTAIFIPSTDPNLVCRLLRFFPGASVLKPGDE